MQTRHLCKQTARVLLVLLPGVKDNAKGAICIQPEVAWHHSRMCSSAGLHLTLEDLNNLHKAHLQDYYSNHLLCAEVGLEPELMLWEANAQDKTGAACEAGIAGVGPSA